MSWEAELQRLQQLALSANRFPEKARDLQSYQCKELPKGAAERLLGTTLGKGLSDTEIRYEFSQTMLQFR